MFQTYFYIKNMKNSIRDIYLEAKYRIGVTKMLFFHEELFSNSTILR